MASTAIRERRRTLRYRHLLVRQMVQMKIKARSLLMEAGVSYNKQRLHKAGYFRELLATNPDIDEGLGSLLRLCRETVVRLGKTESVTKVFFPSSGLERHSSSCAPQKVCVTFHRMYAIHLAPADGVNGIYKLREDIRLLFEGAG